MQLDAGWKDFDNDSDDLNPKAGRYVSFREQPDKGRQKIIDVVANGRKIVLADDKKFLFQSNKMLIHNQPEDDDSSPTCTAKLSESGPRQLASSAGG